MGSVVMCADKETTMIKKIAIIFLLLCMASCKKTEVEKLLTNPDKKWVYLEAENVFHERVATFYMQFNEDNSCNDRYLSNGLILTLVDGPPDNSNWHYDEEKKIIDICGFKFYLTKFTPDTIYLTKLKDQNKFWLVNLKHELIVKPNHHSTISE